MIKKNQVKGLVIIVTTKLKAMQLSYLLLANIFVGRLDTTDKRLAVLFLLNKKMRNLKNQLLVVKQNYLRVIKKTIIFLLIQYLIQKK